MNISEIHDFIDILTSKERGGFSTPAEIDACLDRASLVIFEFYRPRYAKDIEAKEALAPFRRTYNYITNGSGEISISTGFDFTHLLAMDVVVTDAAATAAGFNPQRRWDITFPNEDELAKRKNSQTNPPTATAPIADIVGVGWYNLFPQQVHTGNIMYLIRPPKPFYSYSQVGRTITYLPNSSTQLQWQEPWLNTVIFLAARFLGVNLNSDALVQIMSQFLSEKQ